MFSWLSVLEKTSKTESSSHLFLMPTLAHIYWEMVEKFASDEATVILVIVL